MGTSFITTAYCPHQGIYTGVINQTAEGKLKTQARGVVGDSRDLLAGKVKNLELVVSSKCPDRGEGAGLCLLEERRQSSHPVCKQGIGGWVQKTMLLQFLRGLRKKNPRG